MATTSPPLPTFRIIPDTSVIMDLLLDRLPKSGNLYNMALFHSKFGKEMSFYCLDPRQEKRANKKENEINGTLDNKIGSDSWIIATFQRKEISVSAPKDPFRRLSATTLQNVLLSGTVIDWKRSYVFMALELAISQVFFELSARINENITQVFPDNFFYMDLDTVESTEVESLLSEMRCKKDLKDAEVKSLHSISGIEFLTKHWRYASAETPLHVGQVLKNSPSAGVLVDDEIVSGILLNANGLLGMLSTVPEYKRRKLGTLAMKSLIVTLGKSGYVPCSTAHKANAASTALHESVGFKVSHGVEAIAYLVDEEH